MQTTSSVRGGSPTRDLAHERAPERRAVAGPQSGFSLIEVLVAVALAGTIVLSLVGGLLTLVRIDDETAQRQRVEHGLNNYAEGLRSLDYRDCAVFPANAAPGTYAADYTASPLSWTPPTGMDIEITQIRFWDPSARLFVDSCAATDSGAQELTVVASWRGRTATGQIVLGER